MWWLAMRAWERRIRGPEGGPSRRVWKGMEEMRVVCPAIV